MLGNWVVGDRPFAGQVAAVRIDSGSVALRNYTAGEWDSIKRELDRPAGEGYRSLSQ
jgi:hypothetical protein